MNPFIAEVKNNMGYVYEKLENLDKARKYYEHALRIKADYPEALNNLGFFLAVHKKDYKQAEIYLKKAIKINPISKYFRDSLGYIYLQQNQLNKAREQFEKALLLDSQFLSARQNLTSILFKLARYEECIDSLEGMPENFETLYLKYSCLKMLNKFEDAYIVFQKLKPYYTDKSGLSNPSASKFTLELETFTALSMAEALRMIEIEKGSKKKSVNKDIPFEVILSSSPDEWKEYLSRYRGDFFYSPLDMLASAEFGLNVTLFEKKQSARAFIDSIEIEQEDTRKILLRVNEIIDNLKKEGYSK
jgi:tetratricopeptide (TPR) repeat protein